MHQRCRRAQIMGILFLRLNDVRRLRVNWRCERGACLSPFAPRAHVRASFFAAAGFEIYDPTSRRNRRTGTRAARCEPAVFDNNFHLVPLRETFETRGFFGGEPTEGGGRASSVERPDAHRTMRFNSEISRMYERDLRHRRPLPRRDRPGGSRS